MAIQSKFATKEKQHNRMYAPCRTGTTVSMEEARAWVAKVARIRGNDPARSNMPVNREYTE